MCSSDLEHIALHEIGSGQVIFPVRLFASSEAAGRDRLTQDEIDALGFTDELPNGRRYKHGTLGGYVTARCWCRGASSGARTMRVIASASGPVGRRGSGHPPGGTIRLSAWARTCGVGSGTRPLTTRGFRSLHAIQVRHTHASWLIDQGVDLARVQYRLGHGDLQATTRYVKILDEEDPKAAEVISAILGDVA